VKGERSLAERIAEQLDAPVAAGLHTVAASTIGEEQDALVCGDDEAKRLALELAGRAVAGRAIDAGKLSNARALEGLTGVIVAVNKRYKAHAGVRLTGV
jgi:predicted dinucleotide-binding enzyme